MKTDLLRSILLTHLEQIIKAIRNAELDCAGSEIATNMQPAQIPGCLPQGYDLNSLLTVEQFSIWRQKSVETVRAELPTTKGVLTRTRKDCRIHPRTYLELSLKKRR